MDLGDGTMGYYAPRYANFQNIEADYACTDQLAALGYTDNYSNVEVGTYDDTSTVILHKYRPYDPNNYQ